VFLSPPFITLAMLHRIMKGISGAHLHDVSLKQHYYCIDVKLIEYMLYIA